MLNRSPAHPDSFIPLPPTGASEQHSSQWMSQQRQALADIYPAVLARIKANQERQHPMVATGDKNFPEGTLAMLLDPNNKAMNTNEPRTRGHLPRKNGMRKWHTSWWTKLAARYISTWRGNGSRFNIGRTTIRTALGHRRTQSGPNNPTGLIQGEMGRLR